MRTLSLKLPDAIDAKLTAVAKQRRMAKSALAREVLETYLAAGDGPQTLSCLDLAPDLAGCVESGVGDLSYNKKHLEGFGR